MSDVSFGRYYPADSVIHKLDPRIKIVLMIILMVAVFLCNNYFSIALTVAFIFVMILCSHIKLKVVFSGIKPIIVVVLITAILNLFYGSGEPIFKFWIFSITQDGINSAVFMAARVILLVLVGLMLTYTTTPTSLTDAIESLLKPLTLLKVDVHSFAMTMTIALRFIPTLTDDMNKILSAQKSRGADIENGGLVKRIKAIVPIIIPLFVSSFRRAYELGDAMECRCYRGGNGRTKMNTMHLTVKDFVAFGLVLLYFVAIILIKVYTVDLI